MAFSLVCLAPCWNPPLYFLVMLPFFLHKTLARKPMQGWRVVPAPFSRLPLRHSQNSPTDWLCSWHKHKHPFHHNETSTLTWNVFTSNSLRSNEMWLCWASPLRSHQYFLVQNITNLNIKLVCLDLFLIRKNDSSSKAVKSPLKGLSSQFIFRRSIDLPCREVLKLRVSAALLPPNQLWAELLLKLARINLRCAASTIRTNLQFKYCLICRLILCAVCSNSFHWFSFFICDFKACIFSRW